MGNPEQLREFIRGASRLPVIPEITMRLIKAVDSPDSSSGSIAKIVESVPSLAVRLLKLANSSFYGNRGQISTVRNAVVILGAKTIRSLALADWTNSLRSKARDSNESMLMIPILADSLTAGVTAGMLAERIDSRLGEEAFMAGLLHDIGRVALVAEMARKYQAEILEPAENEGIPIYQKEGAILGFDHCDLGSALMNAWGLPGFLAEVAEQHHDTGILPKSQFFAAAVALADALTGCLVSNETLGSYQRDTAAFFGLVDQEAVAEFLELCVARVNTLTEVFG